MTFANSVTAFQHLRANFQKWFDLILSFCVGTVARDILKYPLLKTKS